MTVGEDWSERDWLTEDEVAAGPEVLAEEVAHSDAIDGRLADALCDLLSARLTIATQDATIRDQEAELRQLRAQLEEGTVQL